MLFEDFKLGFIDSIAADIEFVKDVCKVSVQLQTLTSLQHFVENCEKTNQMVRSSIKQNQQIKSQTQKFSQNGSNFSKNGKNPKFGQKQFSSKPNQSKPSATTFAPKQQKIGQKPPFSNKALIQKGKNGTKNENKPVCSRCAHKSPGNYFNHVTDNLWTSDPSLTTANPNNNFSYTSDAVFNSTPSSSPSKGGRESVLS